MTVIEKAIRLAFSAHEGQLRKDGPPYIIHPVAISIKLAQYGFADEVLAAGLTHDVLEDTAVTVEQLRAELGDTVTNLVQLVTYDEGLSWEDKRTKYIETLRTAPEGAKAISVADKIHNAESLLEAYAKEGPAVWQRFNRSRDKKLWFEEGVLTMLQDTWQHPLVNEYAALVKKMQALEY